MGHAFRKGVILGSMAGLGAMIWNAPQSGERTREQLLDLAESVVFRILDFPASGLKPAENGGPAIAFSGPGDDVPEAAPPQA